MFSRAAKIQNCLSIMSTTVAHDHVLHRKALTTGLTRLSWHSSGVLLLLR